MIAEGKAGTRRVSPWNHDAETSCANDWTRL